MKKYLLIAVLALSVLFVNAQTIEAVIGKDKKAFIEKTSVTDNSCTFGYLEATYHAGAMGKIFHEQKFWNTPAFIHAEYQTTFDGGNVYLIGGGFYQYTKHGFIEFCPMYRYDGNHGVQISLVYLFNTDNIEFYGYNHLWHNGQTCFFGEERIHLKFGRHFRLGLIVDFSYFGSFAAIPSAGVRYDF